MKRIMLFIAVGSLHAASYYVSSAGNDSNVGSLASPWLTLQHAVSSIACGDTINIVANGSYVAGDANLPFLAGCVATNTIQSSAIAQFAPVGYRTNPAKDSAIYGKLQFTNQGISAAAEVHGNVLPTWNCAYMNHFNSGNLVTIANPGVFTVGCAAGMIGGLANGDQLEFAAGTVFIAGTGTSFADPPVYAIPSPLVEHQHYYVVNQSGNGASGATFEVASTPGGTPIQITACDSNCQNRASVAKVVGVSTSTSILTSPNDLVNIANDTPIVLATAGLQSYGTLPTTTPTQIALDTIYYVVNKTDAKHFQIALTPGGTPLTFTSVGKGMFSIANANVPKGWAFRGLELAPNGGALLGYLLQLGGATELSPVGMPGNFEVDRVYMHGNDTVALGQHQDLARCINENGVRVYVHDSYCSGATYSEAQAVLSTQSQGAAYVNNFLQGATENVMCGGAIPSGGLTCGHHLFQGNYFHKPTTWKYTTGTGAASGFCLYDNYDPQRSGGEWYLDTSGGTQLYQCQSNGTWATSTGTPQSTNISFKDCSEHKNGQSIHYIGNIYNYCFTGGQDEVFNNSNESNDSGPGAANDDILIQNNAIYNSWIFDTRSSRCGSDAYMPCVNFPANHITKNNLFVVNPLVCGLSFTTSQCGFNPWQTTWASYVPAAYLQGDTWSHNTIWSPDSCCTIGSTFKKVDFFAGNQSNGADFAIINLAVYQDSLNVGDFIGDASGVGGNTLANYFTNGLFSHNVWRGGNSGNYSNVGATNTWSNAAFPANLAAVKFVNGTGTMAGDYHLDPASNFSAAGGCVTLCSTDGTDLGADIDLINMATSGALAGTPPWDVQAGLKVIPGSTKLVLSYQAPTTAACTATIYNAQVRIATNQVASVADSSASSVSDALTRQLYISGLTASTHYWYKLACGGGVLMVGDLFTRAAGSGTYQFRFDWSTATAMRYSSSATMSSPTTLSAATRQTIPVASDSVIYAQVGTTGPITILIAP